jgi:hypothetical protein
MSPVILRLAGSSLLSNSWKQELVVTTEGVEGEVLRDLKRIKMMVPFDRIAQVNIVRGLFAADIEVVNKGGTGNIVIKALTKRDAEQAKSLIEAKMLETPQRVGAAQPTSVADEVAKLAILQDKGIITEAEFAAQKARLLQ